MLPMRFDFAPRYCNAEAAQDDVEARCASNNDKVEQLGHKGRLPS
jgi:hypothetical protein